MVMLGAVARCAGGQGGHERFELFGDSVDRAGRCIVAHQGVAEVAQGAPGTFSSSFIGTVR
jgi:hypothetical protein